MFSQTFKACMWKNYRARRLSIALTLSEIILPAVMFGMLVYIHIMDGRATRQPSEPEYAGKAYNISQLVQEAFREKHHIDLLFTPPTNITVKIMESVFLDVFVAHNISHKIRTFDGMSSDKNMASWLASKYFKEDTTSSSKGIGFGFVFHNEETPKDDGLEIKLEYKLMCTLSSVKTDNIFPDFIPRGKGYSGEAYITSGIPVLQWHIDKAFIELLYGEKIPFEMTLHSFPYPANIVEHKDEEIYITILLPLFTMISYIFFIPVVVRRVVQEKATGIKELMRIAGLNSWYLWSSWLVHSSVIFLGTTAIVTLILSTKFTEADAFLSYVDVLMLWLLFFMFCLASLIFCFAVTTFYNNPVAAMSCGVVLWIGTFTLLNPLVKAERTPFIIRLGVCLFPTAAVTTGFNIIAFHENRNVKLTWSKLFEDVPQVNEGMNMALVYFMLVLDMVVYSMITWYVDAVKPGTFGIAKPWNFLFQRLKRKKPIKDTLKAEENATYEEPLPYLKVCIYISNLRKRYKDDVIGLDGVNMNIYKNVITVLLGHNGAGKTSLMGIISGLHSPSSGKVYVGGEDIFSNMKKFHRNLGICFQYNYLCSYLSVMEHFIFFGMVKGLSMKKAEKEGLQLLREMNMLDRKTSYIQTLSGGMLRRVSLAIAMIGNPKVLMLDEPTSGMDPETRRDVWDLILKKRGNHTILISTQFMEEADVLGDWIAIMDHGRVVCYGTTPFLKKVYGTGYHLTVTKDQRFDNAAITDIIKSYVPQCTVESNLPGQLNYTLPLESTAKFADMFASLEAGKSDLGISGIGVQCTTIEEVFLKVGEMLQGPKSISFTGYLLANLPKSVRFKDNLTGAGLLFQQFKALLVKKLVYDMRNLLLLIVMIIIPVLVVVFAFPQNTKITNSRTQPSLNISLSMYGNTTVFSSFTPKRGFESQYQVLNSSYQSIVKGQGGRIFFTNNITRALLDYGAAETLEFRLSTIVSTEFRRYVIQAFYNNLPLHAIPVSINLASNSLLKYYFPKSELKISLAYVPVDVNVIEDTCAEATLKMGDKLGHQWAVSMPQCLLCIMTVFILLPAVERSTSYKHIQGMTGVRPLLYWLACFLWDFFLYAIVVLLLVITIILTDKNHIFSSPQDISVLILVLLLYGLSGTTYAYFSSFFGSSTSKIVGNYLVFSICFGMITAIGMNIAVKAEHKGDGILPWSLLQVLTFTLPLCPHYCLVTAVIRFGGGIYQNYLCKNCATHICGEEHLLVFDSKDHQYGILLEIIYLSLDWLLFLILVLLAENKCFTNLYWRLKDMMLDTDLDDDNLKQSSDVRKEKEKTLACSKNRSVDPKAVFMSVGLGKVFSKKSKSVQPMSFRVRKGECFGLLGTNGAGKSTTFKMLVGEVRPTVGDAVNYNCTLMRNRRQYLKTIGYCPQTNALNYAFTGEETLRLFAQLRGIHPRRVETEVDNWIRLLGLSDYRSLPCGTYSSGTLRKLSTAIALIGHPPVVFLDEPTAGVDPFGRRNLWEVLNTSKNLGQAIMLTSHSMQECEALCGRITIMVDGRMMCLGNTQYLKKKFGQGYTVAIVLATSQELQDTLPALKSDVYRHFKRVKLKDEHKKLLHFHIKDENIRLSQLFNIMEQLQQSYSLIESYMLGDTTLEQVFISFAKTHITPEIII